MEITIDTGLATKGYMDIKAWHERNFAANYFFQKT